MKLWHKISIFFFAAVLFSSRITLKTTSKESYLDFESIGISNKIYEIIVNGENVIFETFVIEAYEYIKLRDLAYVLSDTEKQFNVSWDNVNNAVLIESEALYNLVGDEMLIRRDADDWSYDGGVTGRPHDKSLRTNSTFYIDGAKIEIISYNIEGYHYIKLRDIARLLDFNVYWDVVKNMVSVDTSVVFVDETIGTPVLDDGYDPVFFIYMDYVYKINDAGVVEIIRYISNGGAEHVIIPDKIHNLPVRVLDYGSFVPTQYGQDKKTLSFLKSIIIPDSVTFIGNSAFTACRELTYVKIGAGVTQIGADIFSGCDKLETIDVDPANSVFISENGVLFKK